MKTPIEEFKAIYFVCEDANKDLLFRLCFPCIDAEKRSLVCRKRAGELSRENLRYHHYKNRWFYFGPGFKAPDHESRDSGRNAFVVESTDFNPEKYGDIVEILRRIYLKNGTIKSVLSAYLAILADNPIDLEDVRTFSLRDYEQKKIMATKSPLKQIINMFGLDTILIYTALILKRRICVYHHKTDSLIQFVRALPTFVWHRQNWSQILYPLMDLHCKYDISQIERLDHYVAGFGEDEIESKTDLYDVYVNLPAVEITVANHAKDIFAMTKTHKEIALLMKRLAENEAFNDIQVIQQISAKTMELLDTVKALGSQPSEDDSRKLAPALETFLKNLALAEKL